MSTQNTTLQEELAQCNERLDDNLPPSMSVKTFKIIKALTQLVGASAGIYAMYLGADPMLAFIFVTFIIVGPETIDYILSIES